VSRPESAGATALRSLGPAAPIVFLHIPKTAGQTIHSELTRIAGAGAVSPVRVHSQVKTAKDQLPDGYSVYSGHLDWTALDTLPPDRFTFSVLRDPRERIASFYFYTLKEARAQPPGELDKPHRAGMKMISTVSADDYFFAGSPSWQVFVHDHYDNFYTHYFATRTMRGWKDVRDLPAEDLLARARAHIARDLDRVYTTRDLGALETDIAARYGTPISVADRFVNTGDQPQGAARWPRLLARFERDDSRARLEAFAARDDLLLAQLGLAV
jgi:hypothetical protein